MMATKSSRFALLLLPLAAAAFVVGAAAPSADEAPPAGLDLLLHEPLSMPTFTADELARLWTVWDEPDRSQAEASSPSERRRLVFERYGLIPRGDAAPSESELPLGYASADGETFVPNCLACHGGRVAGRVIPGLANNEQDLTGLVGDLLKLRSEGAASPEAGILALFPLNFSRGSTNATMYSILLGSLRDENLDQVFPPKVSQPYVHNTIDAPAWWLYSKKERIYWDGMAPKTTRTLMQFTMAPGLSGETIRAWEDEFEVIHDYIDGLEPPRYPFEIDRDLAARGRRAFESECAECHGTYGDEPTYPNRTVPLSLVGTDPVRLDAIRPESKAKYNQSWFSNYGEHPVIVAVRGYVAPPLDGVWATAPYLHNGSVPTLWHMLHPDERPALWRHQGTTDYDEQRAGLVIETFEALPEGLSERERRFLYDTSRPSQSNDGHRFPERLTLDERRAVLEYLKTL